MGQNKQAGKKPRKAASKSRVARAVGDKKKTRTAQLGAPGGGVDVTFDLDTKTNAKLARCYLKGDKGSDLANNAEKPHGVLKNQTLGTKLSVVVDVSDVPSPNKRGIFKVTHTNQPSISATSEDGTMIFELRVV